MSTQKFYLLLEVERGLSEARQAVIDAIAASPSITKQQCLALQVGAALQGGEGHCHISISTDSRTAASALLRLWHPACSADFITEALVQAQMHRVTERQAA